MRALLLYPRFPPSFWSYEEALALIGRKAMQPPLALITVASILPQAWDFRLVDCNTSEISEDDWAWAEIVLLSGMIVQKTHMLDLIRQAKRRGVRVAVGGPYVTSVPEDARTAGADFLVLDEGEVTIPPFVAALARGETSGTFRANGAKADVSTSPIPRYDLLNLRDYADLSIQFSRGCPFLCEFCDIIILYGRRPRTKPPAQIIGELQKMYDLGWRGNVFMVDDNFIGNKRNAKAMLTRLAAWQAEHDFPFILSTEASVDLADDPELLAMMRAANFKTVFLGIETPDTDSLKLTKKSQNVRRSLLAQVQTIHAAGIRVTASFVIGFDGEKAGVNRRIADFVDEAAIAHAFVNMLQALPQTHLTERLRLEGRLLSRDIEGNNSCLPNFVPTRPLRELAREHVDLTLELYTPEKFLERAFRQCQLSRRRSATGRTSGIRDVRDLRAIGVLVWRHGIKRRTRLQFWRYAAILARQGSPALVSFLSACGAFEHLRVYREHVRDQVEAQLAAFTDEELDRIYEHSDVGLKERQKQAQAASAKAVLAS